APGRRGAKARAAWLIPPRYLRGRLGLVPIPDPAIIPTTAAIRTMAAIPTMATATTPITDIATRTTAATATTATPASALDSPLDIHIWEATTATPTVIRIPPILRVT